MGKEIVFFDLDNTLWYIKSDVLVINKNKPEEPIIKISQPEFALIKSGIYVKDDICIDYNNEKFYISKDMLERILRRNKNIRLRDIGISYSEYFDEYILNKKEVQLLLNNIKYFIGRDIDVGVLTARSDRKLHANLLNKLRLKLAEYGLEIDKIYFVSESIKMSGSFDKVSYNKNKILLEHLVGLTISGNRFIPVKKESYDKIYFCDDVESNILSINNLQEYFDFLVRNSEDEVIEFINNRLNSHSLILVTNLVTNNELNPFETKVIKLAEPIKYPIKVQDSKLTVKFENFKRNQ